MAAIGRHNATDHRTGRVNIPAGLGCQVDRLFKVIQLLAGTPQHERHRIHRRNLAPIAEHGDDILQPGGRVDVLGPSDAAGRRAVGQMF